ncbi:MAG TPA: LLM class flavin-dependent oxidoreductase [Thermomicrobiales bacterium]|nr:LLM class flavin-dependent oxidoreductase [Thermomicrobiales bacterium]
MAWNRWPTLERKPGVGVILSLCDTSPIGTARLGMADVLAQVQALEAAGFDSVWVPDHFLHRAPVMEEGQEVGCWEAWVAMAAIAQATTRIQIGILVTCLPWRNPGIVARMTETIEEISGGRFVLGVGAGWHQPEYDAYGLPFDHRYGRFEDAFTILEPLLRTGRADHQGTYFSATDAINIPRGPRAEQGGPPILFGTKGEKMVELTARFADAWNTSWYGTPEDGADSRAAMLATCARVGRDPQTLVKTVGINVALTGGEGQPGKFMAGTPAEIAAGLRAFADAGYDHLIAGIEPCTVESIAEFAEALALYDAH